MHWLCCSGFSGAAVGAEAASDSEIPRRCLRFLLGNDVVALRNVYVWLDGLD